MHSDVTFSGPHLITRSTSWLQSLCMMSPTIDTTFSVEVDEVHQDLLTGTADETSWMPTQ